ncbi:MAG: alpha/beta hydrolase [Thermomicrobiales bacterium]
MHRPRWRSLCWACVLLLMLGSVVPGALPPPAMAQATPGRSLPDMGQTALTWRDCDVAFFGLAPLTEDFGDSACGVLTVPENWTRPGARQVELEFVVLKATGDTPQPDPVVYLSGGPGGTTLAGASAWAETFAGIREHRDVVLYDQRGTAYSSPLRCSSLTVDQFFASNPAELVGAAPPDADASAATPTPEDATPEDLQDDVAGAEIAALPPAFTASALMDQARAAVGDETLRCVQELLAQGVDLRQYTSVASATDLMALMQALEYDEFNLYGISYGTRLALVTMREYPDAGIRSVILDSTYPVGLHGFERFPSEPHEVVIQLFADCHLDPVCNGAYPHLKARFIALLAALEAQPLVVNEEITITESDLIELMQAISSAVAMAPYIPKMIAELEAGDPTTYLGLVSGELLAPPDVEATDDAGATPEAAPEGADATPVDPQEAQAVVLRDVVSAFLTRIGVGDVDQAVTPAQAFLAEVTYAIGNLPTAPANELTIRLLLLDQLPATRDTLTRFVELAFDDPALAAEQAALRDLVPAMSDADIDTVFAYLAEPLQVVNPTASNEFMFNAVECHESVPFQSYERTIETALELEIPELGLNTVAPLASMFAICEVWPGGRAPDSADLPVSSEIPALIFAGTYDMQTPLSWNKQAYVTLANAGLVIFPMSGHGVLTVHTACATQIANAFLDDPIYLPDSRCVADYFPVWALPDAG